MENINFQELQKSRALIHSTPEKDKVNSSLISFIS